MARVPDGNGRVSTTIYFPQHVYERLVLRKSRGKGKLYQQVVQFVQEGLAREDAQSGESR